MPRWDLATPSRSWPPPASAAASNLSPDTLSYGEDAGSDPGTQWVAPRPGYTDSNGTAQIGCEAESNTGAPGWIAYKMDPGATLWRDGQPASGRKALMRHSWRCTQQDKPVGVVVIKLQRCALFPGEEGSPSETVSVGGERPQTSLTQEELWSDAVK